MSESEIQDPLIEFDFDGAGNTATMQRFQLTTALEAHGSAEARWLLWTYEENELKLRPAGNPFLVWDPFGIHGVVEGTCGWAIFMPDSKRFEVVKLERFER
jgi:hypothetical protein